jgi:transcriptional regulator with XRE-family HTH domain
MSQAHLARLAGIGRSTLVHLEAGADARLSRIAAVAKALGAEIEAISEPRNILQRRQARAEQNARMLALQVAHLWIAAKLLLNDPRAVAGLEDARRMVSLWERERVCSRFYVDSWRQLLKGSPRDVGKAISGMDERWRPALLQNTPFGSLVSRHS